MDFEQTSIRAGRPILSYRKIQILISIAIRNQKAFVRPPKEGDYLDFGCGANVRSDFYDVDWHWMPGVDLCWNLTRLPLPIISNVIGGIFTEHFIEHITFDQFCALADEFHRILKPGAYLRVIVPDGEIYLRRYVDMQAMPYAHEDVTPLGYTPIMSVNRIFRGEWEHKFIYDMDAMKLVLANSGYDQIKKCSFGSGSDKKLLIDSPSRAVESLYVEARKPV
jgi:predicted SAM-dependent methyltransferase